MGPVIRGTEVQVNKWDEKHFNFFFDKKFSLDHTGMHSTL